MTQKGFMNRPDKRLSPTKPGKLSAAAGKVSHVRKANHLKDEVYREMLLLEVNRPGAEMGLALALLRAFVQSEGLAEPEDFQDWLKTICPLGLRMIETALNERRSCDLDQCQSAQCAKANADYT